MPNMSWFSTSFKTLLSISRFLSPPAIAEHQNGKPSTVIPSVVGTVHFRTAARFGQLTNPSARDMDELLRNWVDPPCQSIFSPIKRLNCIKKEDGIDSITWKTLQHVFDACSYLCHSKEPHRKKKKDSLRRSAKQFAYPKRTKDRRAKVHEDVMEELRKFVNDDDVFVNTSPLLEEIVGLLVRPLSNAPNTGACADEDMSRECTFTDINVLRYVNLESPYIKVSRLQLVVSIEFDYLHKPPVDWNITGVYDSSNYFPQESLEGVQQLGLKEMQRLIQPGEINMATIL